MKLSIYPKIWEYYFLKQTLKIFLLFLVCFYGLYVLIDYAHNSSHFRQHGQIAVKDLMLFYAFEFVDKMDVLLPFALLIATIKTLCTLNANNELVALMTSGIRLKILMRPFLIIALCLTSLTYLSTEVFLPKALKQLRRIDETRAKEKQKKNHYPMIQHLTLEDESMVIFQNYDPSKELFFDAYWIRSPNDIYRIKYLLPHNSIPTGQYVEHLQRDQSGNFLIQEFHSEKQFPDMHFNKELLIETVIPPDELSLSELSKKTSAKKAISSEKESRILSIYYYKLAMPWLCLFAVIGPAPYCVRFTRNLPVFFIYAGSIFGLVAFYLIMDSALILGERQVLAPFWAIWIPFTLFFSIFGLRFLKL